MRPVAFIYPADNIFQDVKREASYYAERKFDNAGESLFEQLVFDEEYTGKFRELFLDARAEIAPLLAPFAKNVPVAGYFEQTDFTDDVNAEFQIAVADDFPDVMIRPVDTKIREYLIAYIMYRWLETKIPQEAQIYYMRMQELKKYIKNALNTLHAKTLKTGLWNVI
jgi:uncharacterized membrane-anchored protein YjiN (DUF445 family)